jgi:hypothetical protein
MLTFLLATAAATSVLTVDTPDGAIPATTPVEMVVAATVAFERWGRDQEAFERWDAERMKHEKEARRHRKHAVSQGVLGGVGVLVGSALAGVAFSDEYALCVVDGFYGIGGCDGSMTKAARVFGVGLGLAGVAMGGSAIHHGNQSVRSQRAIGPEPRNSFLVAFESMQMGSLSVPGAPEEPTKTEATARADALALVHRAKTHADRETQVDAWRAILRAYRDTSLPDEAHRIHERFILDVLDDGSFSRREAAIAYGDHGSDLAPLVPLLETTGGLTRTAVKRGLMRIGRRTQQVSEAERAILDAGLLVPPQ